MEQVRTLAEHLGDYAAPHPNATMTDVVDFVEGLIEGGDLLATEDAALNDVKRRALAEELEKRYFGGVPRNDGSGYVYRRRSSDVPA